MHHDIKMLLNKGNCIVRDLLMATAPKQGSSHIFSVVFLPVIQERPVGKQRMEEDHHTANEAVCQPTLIRPAVHGLQPRARQQSVNLAVQGQP
jgi:hypothetical protein